MTSAELEREARSHAGEIARVMSAFDAIAAGENVTDYGVLRVLRTSGYVETAPEWVAWFALPDDDDTTPAPDSPRVVFTDKGRAFHAAQRRHGRTVRRVIGDAS